MSQIPSKLSCLFRPRLLMRAARFGLRHYDRTRHLPRLLGDARVNSGLYNATKLMDLEAELDCKRTERDASYSAQRHVDILTALLAEIEHIRSSNRASAA